VCVCRLSRLQIQIGNEGNSGRDVCLMTFSHFGYGEQSLALFFCRDPHTHSEKSELSHPHTIFDLKHFQEIIIAIDRQIIGMRLHWKFGKILSSSVKRFLFVLFLAGSVVL